MLRADGDAQTIQSLAEHLGCPPAIARILVTRGIDTPSAAEAFLNPTLEALLDEPATDPAQLLGMDAAVERILSAIRNAEPILIYGDYDVDGTTATALLKTTIERIGLADAFAERAIGVDAMHGQAGGIVVGGEEILAR